MKACLRGCESWIWIVFCTGMWLWVHAQMTLLHKDVFLWLCITLNKRCRSSITFAASQFALLILLLKNMYTFFVWMETQQFSCSSQIALFYPARTAVNKPQLLKDLLVLFLSINSFLSSPSWFIGLFEPGPNFPSPAINNTCSGTLQRLMGFNCRCISD